MEERLVNRASLPQARLIAYDALYRMIEAAPTKDHATAWKHFRAIRNWTGKHTILRSGKNALTLETI